MEVAGVPMDQTPGTKQSSRLIVELLAFLKDIGVQMRVSEYHALLDRLATTGGAKR